MRHSDDTDSDSTNGKSKKNQVVFGVSMQRSSARPELSTPAAIAASTIVLSLAAVVLLESRREKEPAILVKDAGVGQHPSDFEET